MKKKPFRAFVLILCIIFGIFCLTACGDSSDEDNDIVRESDVPDDVITIKDSDTDTDTDGAIQIILNGDSAQCDDKSVSIDKNTITLTSEGDYILSGTLDNGQIIIDAGDSDKVHLILDNADIHCDYSAPIYVKNADKTTLTLNSGSDNSLSDGSSYTYDDEEAMEPDAVIFSKDDLSINGSGTLTIDAVFNNGITCKDDLKIVGGTINVTAAGDGIKGRDSLTITDGSISVSCEGKGLLSNNDEDETKGYIHITGGDMALNCTDDAIHSNNAIYFEGGNADITSGDDGIHADKNLIISAGTINITQSYEGLEAANISINDGDISISASDDGINATEGSSGNEDGGFGGFGGGRGGAAEANSNCSLTVTGGTIYVNAGGDGIDSNGYIDMTGGVMVVDGPTDNGNGGLDYGSYFTISGGYVAVAGSSGMAQGMSADSSQCSALVALTNGEAGTPVTVTDENGSVILSFTPSKSYNCINISSPDMKTGSTYYVYLGGTVSGSEQVGKDLYIGGTVSGGTELLNYEQSSISSTYGNAGGGFGGGGFGGDGNRGDFGGNGGPKEFDDSGNAGDFGTGRKDFKDGMENMTPPDNAEPPADAAPDTQL